MVENRPRVVSSQRRSRSNATGSNTNDGRTSHAPQNPKSSISNAGHLRAPTELGKAEYARAAPSASPALRHVKAHPRTFKTRQLAKAVVMTHNTPSAILDEREIFDRLSTGETSLCKSFTYQGMEVLAGVVDSTCYLLCGRTRLVFQMLNSPCTDTLDTIISLRVHAATGQIVVVTRSGKLTSFSPEPTKSLESSFGRFRWQSGPSTDCARMFYSDFYEAVSFDVAKSVRGLDVSLADDNIVLLAHRDQLTVLDADPSLKESEMLWMTRLPSPIITAQISGDSQSIAVVLEQNPDDKDVEDSDGVHTLERDWDDGSSNRKDNARTNATGEDILKKEKKTRSGSVGILYKPGPFLVHSAPVTRLSFRGHGRENSQHPVEDIDRIPGNDLLLTVSQDNSVQIFGQSNWKPLTNWTMAPKTRVDWVAGTSIIALGDLEGKSTSSAKKPSSKRPSSENLAQLEKVQNEKDTNGNGHSHFSSVPTHAAPVSKAGAWICEVCCEEPGALVRLSRLTYLKRGADDLSAALFESVSGYLPSNTVFSEALLWGCDDPSTLTIEGFWPAWDPFTGDMKSGPTDSTTETLRGSAMAFLGLDSSQQTGQPVGAGGNFIDPQLLGTQCPPTDLRLTLSHSVSGQISVLDCRIHGDKSLTSLELGSVSREILALSEFQSTPRKDIIMDRNSVDHGDGRLWATLLPDSVIRVYWRRQGAFAVLPFNWDAEDGLSSNNSDMLSNSTRMKDESLLVAPIALRPFQIPKKLREDKDQFVMITWMPNSDIVGSPPGLLAFTREGKVVAFSVVSPMVAATAEVGCLRATAFGDTSLKDFTGQDDQSQGERGSSEYEVSIVPDPELGLGLRLESLDDGQPAIAGSFKKNPVNNGLLPAEKTGSITLGDMLVNANGLVLEDKTFDEIINTVRELGAASGPGHPMRLRFRRQEARRSPSQSGTDGSEGPGRRTMKEMLGLKKTHTQSGIMRKHSNDSAPSIYAKKSEEITDNIPFAVNDLAAILTSLAKVLRTDTPSKRIAMLPWKEDDVQDGICVLFCCASGFQLEIAKMHFRQDVSSLESELFSSMKFEEEVDIIQAISSADSSHRILILDVKGQIKYADIASNNDRKIHSSTIQNLAVIKAGSPSDVSIYPHSETLFASLEKSSDSQNTLHVWSSKPEPGYDPKTSQDIPNDTAGYVSSTIHIHGSSSDGVLDVIFVHSGLLRSFPWLVVFERNGFGVHHKPDDSEDWLPLSFILYSKLSSSVAGQGLISSDINFDSAPLDIFTHVVPLLRQFLIERDEREYLMSDWHPDSVLSTVCMNSDGAKDALDKHVKGLYKWLCSNATNVPEDQSDSPLLCAPMALKEILSQRGASRDETNSESATNAIRLLEKISGSDEAELMRKFQKILKDAWSQETDAPVSEEMEMPSMLRHVSTIDYELLWAIGELLLDPPQFGSCDKPGQIFVFSASLHSSLLPIPGSVSQGKKAPPRFMVPSVLRKDSFNRNTGVDSTPVPQVSSGACALALVSDSQENILLWVKQVSPKLDWETARRLRLPFWVRSDKALAQKCEEIGQTIFREKRDIMECALFFIIARKTRTLKNLAATDHSESGRKFYNFITSYDFSSERGRRAAEKNAFSLLRKCKYLVASAFFLLAEPPSLQSAIETIVSKLNDADLAFMVARLMESKSLSKDANTNGIGSGFGGVLGGGGGYAGSGLQVETPIVNGSTPFLDWSPSLGRVTKKLIIDRLFKSSAEDEAACAIQLIWINNREEAAWWLPGFIKASPSSKSGYRLSGDAGSRLAKRCNIKPNRFGSIQKANVVIDLASIPLLLKSMGASIRARHAASLVLSNCLISKGIEIPGIMAASSVFDLSEESRSRGEKEGSSNMAEMNGDVQSSIFDNFDVPSARKSAPQAVAKSSIFDSYDVPPSSQKSSSPQSSIFDSFDVPTAAQPKPDKAQSSIFDSYDVPQTAAPKPSSQQSSIFEQYEVPQPVKQQQSAPQSSIFDAFDVQPASKPAPSNQQSSIFDQYDTPQMPKSSTSAATNGSMQSSIFDQFDSPATKARSAPINQDSSNAESVKANPLDSLPEAKLTLSIPSKPVPEVWQLWTERAILHGAARRLLREVASVLGPFHGDPPENGVVNFLLQKNPLLPSGASEVLQVFCDAPNFLGIIRKSLDEICSSTGVDKSALVNQAVIFLGGPSNPRRLLFDVFLHAAVERNDLVDCSIRLASQTLIQLINTFAFGLDDTCEKRQTRHQASSIHTRRLAARLCWQLEISLWLHRSGGIHLSGMAFKEATVAVRLGVVLSSWNRAPEAIEAVLRCEPDALLDEEGGMYLWSSLKHSVPDGDGDKARKATSGGWEFFVDCRRSEATKILRESPTGSFVIRPHPNDNGVFTLSFKTNLVPGEDGGALSDEAPGDEEPESNGNSRRRSSKPVKKDDVVQHAIVRLSDSGFRCGSFGPFLAFWICLNQSLILYHLSFDLIYRLATE